MSEVMPKYMREQASTPLTLSPEAWSIQTEPGSKQCLIVPSDATTLDSAQPHCDNNDGINAVTNTVNNIPTADWFNAEYWLAQGKITGTNTGRGITYFIQHGKLNMVLRRYLRGGLIAKLIKQSFWFAGFTHTRVYQEMALLEYMRRCDLPVPTPIAGMITRHYGLIYRNAILIERIANAQDLHACLLQQSLPEHTWTALGHTIARMHLARVDHHDLNIENILLDQQDKLWLIDFDKCGVFAQDSVTAWPVDNIARLARSIRKQLTLHSTYHVTANDWTALLSGYQAQLQSEAPEVVVEISDKLNAIRI